MTSFQYSRRDLLKVGALSTSLATLSPWSESAVYGRSPGANEQIRVGVIGTGVRGKYLIGNLPEQARVTAICDCATSRLASTLEPTRAFAGVLSRFREQDAERCQTYQDYRQLIDNGQLDAVIIATPDHHHVQAAMLALQAGLHVYLEKPLSVCIGEGRLLVEMVKRSGRILQVGSQQRSMEINRFACQWIRDGNLGRVHRVDLPNYPGPLTIPEYPSDPIEKGLDWNLFLGPTAMRPHSRKLWIKDEFKVGPLTWRGWDLFRDFSGHMMTNWGAHTVDMVQFALGRDDTGPNTIQLVRPESLAEVGNTWKQKTPLPESDAERRFWPVHMRYTDSVELRFIHEPDFIRFYGERGTLTMRRNAFETDPPDLVDQAPDPELAQKWNAGGHVARPHLQNWLDAIQGDSPLHAPVEAGHRTATICHLANIVRELDRPLQWDPKAERFDDQDANSRLDRDRRSGFELPRVS